LSFFRSTNPPNFEGVPIHNHGHHFVLARPHVSDTRRHQTEDNNLDDLTPCSRRHSHTRRHQTEDNNLDDLTPCSRRHSHTRRHQTEDTSHYATRTCNLLSYHTCFKNIDDFYFEVCRFQDMSKPKIDFWEVLRCDDVKFGVLYLLVYSLVWERRTSSRTSFPSLLFLYFRRLRFLTVFFFCGKQPMNTHTPRINQWSCHYSRL